MLAPVLLRHAHDQLLADVAREVEVDVRHRGQLVVEEATEREIGRDGIDVREPGQVADDRADGRAAAASRRQHLPRDRLAAHFSRDIARELEHLPVQQEEAGEPDPLDQVELLVEALPRAPLVPVEIRVALPEQAVAERAQLCDRRRVAVREVRIAVAELLGQVELEPLRELGRARDRFPVVGKPLVHLLGREQHRLVVAAPLALAAVERRAVVDGDERVLQADARARVRVRIAGRNRRDAERLGEIAQRRVASHVAALVWTLQLDEEAVAAESLREPRGGVGIADREPVARAAGEADEPFVQLLEQRLLECRRHGLRLAPGRPRVLVRGREQTAEVRVAARRLHEQRHVGPPCERHLRAGDRPHAERLRRVRELERAVDAVVVGQRERLVAELRRANGQFLGQRGPVEEGIRRMTMEFGVRHQAAVGWPRWSGRWQGSSVTSSSPRTATRSATSRASKGRGRSAISFPARPRLRDPHDRRHDAARPPRHLIRSEHFDTSSPKPAG